MFSSLSWYLHDLSRSLARARLRSLLIVLAVGAGTFASSLLLGIREGLEQRARDLLSDLGADTGVLNARRDGRSLLTAERLGFLRGEFPGLILSGERVQTFPLQGVGPTPFLIADTGLLYIRPQLLREGRGLDPADARSSAPYAVACASLGLRPGAVLIVEDHALTVIGTAALDGQVWVLPELRLNAEEQERPFDSLRMRGQNPEALRGRLQSLYPAARVTLTTPDDLLRETRRWQRLVTAGFGTIAGLFFLLGGSALMSVMMLSVQQRRSEIGLRMALGASETNIFTLFAGEGLFLSFLAGLAGAGLAFVLIGFSAFPAELPLRFTGSMMLVPVLFSVLVGFLFTSGPALHAAAQSPADVLRPE